MMARENFLAIAALRSSKRLQLYAHNSFKSPIAKTTALRASEQFSPSSSTLLKISSHKALLLFLHLHQSTAQKPEPTTTATAALVTPSKSSHIPNCLLVYLHHRTIASSPHSETNEPPIPDYNAIGINSQTPLRISLRHLAKKELSNHEVIETAYLSRHGAPTIAISTLESPTRFYDTSANQVSCLQNQHGVNMLFSRNGRQWAYLSEEDGKGLNAANHDGINFKKPVVYLGDYINGRKVPAVKWPGAKPLAFSEDGNWLAVGSTRGRVGLMDCSPNINKASVVIPCHLDEVTHAVFTPNSNFLITQSRDGTIRITDVASRASIAKLETDTWKKPLFLGTSPDGEVIVSLWGDTVFHWNHGTAALESYNLSGRRTREGWPIAVSADCRFLCCRTDDGVDVSDLYSGRVLYTIKFQSGFVTAASFSWDGKYLILGKAASYMGLKMGTSTLDVWELVF